jgi:3'-5' exoribonuclease
MRSPGLAPPRSPRERPDERGGGAPGGDPAAEPTAGSSRAATVTIATLRSGQTVDGIFACQRKERQLARTGAPYLTVELRDRTGTIVGRAFRDADLLAGRFERGDLVRVTGVVSEREGRRQLDLHTIAHAHGDEIDPASFLPASRRDLDELEGFLEHLAREVYDPALASLLARLLGDRELRAALRRAPCAPPGARGAHHAYLGGLLEHTVAVASLAVELCMLHPRLDRDLLLCAAIVHDLGKTREYEYGATIERSEEGRLLGHIELGLRLLARHAPAGLPAARLLALEHCVMLHHGADPAAARTFASAEALALHRLNALDAGVKGALEGELPRG